MAGYPPPPGSGYPYSASGGGGGGYGAPAPYGQKPPKEGKTSSSGGGGGGGGGSYGAAPPAQPYGGSGSYGSAPPAGAGHGQQAYGGGGYGHGSPFAALVPSAFPPGTDPNVVACFRTADRDGSGVIDDRELQTALSGYSSQSFSLRTVHLLMYLFTNTNVRKIGPKEFTSVFYSLQNWRGIFERHDRDRSGKIDASELRDALLGLGYSVSPTVLDLLVSKFDKTGGKNKAVEYDNFIELRRREEEEEEEAGRRLTQRATASSRRVAAAAVAAAQVAATVIAIRTLDYVSFRRGSAGGPGDGAAATADCCAVCLGELDAGEVCCALPACGHEFHRECVEVVHDLQEHVPRVKDAGDVAMCLAQAASC